MVHFGGSGGGWLVDAICRLASISFMPRFTFTIFSRSPEGRFGSGPAKMPTTLRVIWIGVRTSPQGKPHQPRNREKKAPPIWLLVAHGRQETCGELFH